MMRLARPLLTPIVRRVLGPHFKTEDVRAIVDAAFADYERQRPRLRREKELGPRMMVHFAALTAGFYRAVQTRLPDEEAKRLTAEVTWLAYEKMAVMPWGLARLTRRTPFSRLLRATELFRQFPFRAPGYDMVDVPADDDVVAFDVRRCPVAEYFQAQGLSQVCVAAWCNLDVPLAKKWGARLERTGTLAEGANRCDFRWHVEPAAKSVPSGRQWPRAVGPEKPQPPGA